MNVSHESIIKDDDSNQSLEDVIHAQKQLDEELQQLKNRYSRYSQLVSFQQEEEDYLKKNKENVNSRRISLSLKRKKDVTYGLMPHDDFSESIEEEESKFEDKNSIEAMTKTANSFINSIKEKNLKMKKEFELPPTPPKEEKIEEKIEENVLEENEENNNEQDKTQDKEMNRLCDLVQSLLSEAQDAIDTKPELNHPDIGKDEEEDPEIIIPKRLQSLNAHRPSAGLNLDSINGLDDYSSSNNKHLSILTDTTAIAQPLAPVNTHCGDGLDDFDEFDMSKYDSLKSPYNAMTSTPNDEFMKGNTSMADGYLNYPPPPPKFYPPPEYFYGANGYPPYFDPAYGPIPPYVWEEIQKQRLGLKPDEEISSEAAVSLNRRKEDQEIIKQTTTTTTTTTTEVKKDKKEVVDGKALVKKRRRRKHHHRHIRPVDADGNICECPVHTKSLVKKKSSSKLFKAQFGSDTQLFLSFFASFFVTTILVTISCLWSVIQVMAGNVNDKNLSRLLMSSSENAIQNNKKKIEQILDKESSESTESEDDDSEDDSDSESESESKLLTDGNSSISDSSKFVTAPSLSDESEVITIPSKFNENATFSNTLNRNSTSSVNTHRRRNSL
ncbi:hypothetical protein BCR32DRAFT_287056 [Anaeromyces robustus]|uniref:Uncharacterized protein n=1 Tax=Anaeromyces robustus TaxID=1754192 RepID=A0A1Y1VU36_9FUNG|nr:hypothetical protein BCR32DRAFT_287056 [Anaeromyces robustus]|eukprot:ORX64515.1 hypothetical protein BCR32DRAFT_287056 [Anaeromyces robustus]